MQVSLPGRPLLPVFPSTQSLRCFIRRRLNDSPLQRYIAIRHGDHGNLQLVWPGGQSEEYGEHIVDTFRDAVSHNVTEKGAYE